MERFWKDREMAAEKETGMVVYVESDDARWGGSILR